MKDGIIVVHKPKDFTSRDVVNKVSHFLKIKKVGHTGTLDPMATGVLVLCVGRYTKLVDKIVALKKEYIATISCGIKTDTLDITGTVLEEKECSFIKEDVINTMNQFLGKSRQEVPIYSAKKINGKKLYQYARNHEDVILPFQEIELFELELLSFSEKEIKFRTVVSKGTYIRSLIRDICDALNIIGTMSSLVRTKQGDFSLKNAVTLEEIEKNNYSCLKFNDLEDVRILELDENNEKRIMNGNVLFLDYSDCFLLFRKNNQDIAVYQKMDDCYKVFLMLK